MSAGIQLLQRYELAAALCKGLRVLDLGTAPAPAREPLVEAAGELVVAKDGGLSGSFDAVVALGGLAEPDRSGSLLERIERMADAGVRVLVALEPAAEPGWLRHGAARAPEQTARALAERVVGGQVLRQFLAEGAVIRGPETTASHEPALRLLDGEAGDEDAAAFIVAGGFEEERLGRALVGIRVAAAPVMQSYVRGLEAAHAELLRANRQLMRERIGRDGSAAASLLNAQRELEKMRAIARGHEEQARRVEAWYDAPRYHLVDRVRDFITKVPGLQGLLRLLWSLVSTRAESPRLDAAAHPDRDERAEEEATEVTVAREAHRDREDLRESPEAYSRLEE